MKNRKWLAFVSLLLLCCMLAPSVLAAADVYVYVSHNRNVNVRKGPGASYSAIGEAKSGQVYEYLGTSNGWHQIRLNSYTTGYVSGNLTELVSVSTENRTSSSISDWDLLVYVTNPNPVNIRKGPHKSYSSMGTVSPKAILGYHGTENGWHCIELGDGTRGYIANNMAVVIYASSYEEVRYLVDLRDQKCSWCGGDGFILTDDCSLCDGHGYL